VRIRSRDGVVVAVHDLGGDGPPLMLAHATGFHGLAWDGFADRLATTFRVWSLDFRAHGASDRPPNGDLSWGRMADDLLAVVDAADLRHPFIVGHSLGGAVSLLAEAAQPGTFRAMYLYEPATFPGPARPPAAVASNPMSDAARRRRAVFESRRAAHDNYATKPPLNELSPAALAAYVDHGFADRPDGTVELRCRPEDEAEVFAQAGASGAFDALASVRCPVTVARGSLDSPGPAGFALAVADGLPASRFVVLDGLGHFGPLAEPDHVAASVVESLLGG